MQCALRLFPFRHFFFFFNDTATTEIYTLSLHDALPISADLDQLGVAQELLDAELGAVAVAAEHLHRGVGDLLGGSRGEQLRGVGPEPAAHVRADARRDVADQRAHRLDPGVALPDAALDRA